MLDDTQVPVLLITTNKHYHDDYSMPVDPSSDFDSDADETVQATKPAWTAVLDGADQFTLDDITNCPLNLLKYPQLVSRLASRLDHAIGLDAFTGMYNAQYGVDLVSPFTRQPILGCIPLGTHHQHAHLGSFVVRRITTKGAVLGNAHLWVAAVYLVIKEHVPRLSQNAALMAAFRKHLKYRLSTFESNLALSGLPGYPMFKVPLGVGLWYCLSGSTALFAENSEMQGQERLRQMWGVARHMGELVEGVCGWPAGDAWQERAAVMRAFAYLMSRKNDGDKMFADVRRLYQASVVVSNKPIKWTPYDMDVDVDPDKEEGEVVVLVDGPPTPDMVQSSPAAWLLDILPLPTIVKLASLVDPQCKFGDVALLPSSLANLPTPQPKTNYGYNYSIPCTDGPTPICPATLRPFVQDVRDRKLWSDRAADVYKCPVDDQLSAYSLFIDFVETRKAYPRSVAELVEYYAVRESGKAAENRPRDTLPRDVVEIAEEVVAAYVRAFDLVREQDGASAVMGVDQFKRVVSKTYNKEKRKEMEDEWVKANGGVRKVKTMFVF
ncbi:hypothetical protein BCR44DRAFT_55686 [Catenaria anguillulae PL171]|uniref:Uncharacterized protein n=1 Tax=Catenaria anguillulae PL171 TaxID=765915 RepID=A0A1Y2HTM4_9FUNG|nr:hypothetical protein BCR44DRAFT_55686 [Catenaria anguillulae PL171]